MSWTLIGQVAGAVAALATLAFTIWRTYLSPAAKRKKEALKQGKKAADDGDISGVTASFDKLNRLPVILAALLFLTGCGVTLHPIDQRDIIRIKAGEKIAWTDLDNVRHDGVPKDGYFISDLYLKEVMQAKVK